MFLTYFDARPVSVQAESRSASCWLLRVLPELDEASHRHRVGPQVSGCQRSVDHRADVWCCGHAIYIMDKVEMDEMKGLFCVDIIDDVYTIKYLDLGYIIRHRWCSLYHLNRQSISSSLPNPPATSPT